MASPVDAMCEQLGWAAELTAAGEIAGRPPRGAVPRRGPVRRAAPEHLLTPDPLVLRKLLDAGQGCVRTVTVAPELPGALDLIDDLVAAGVVAAIGHTDATYEQAAAGFAAGATPGHPPVQRDGLDEPARARARRRGARRRARTSR